MSVIHYRNTGLMLEAKCGSKDPDWTTQPALVTCEDCREKMAEEGFRWFDKECREAMSEKGLRYFGLTGEEEVEMANQTQVGGSHYKDLKIQPWDVIKAWMPSGENVSPFSVYLWGNALKYLSRLGRKGSVVEEVDKAIHYLQALREELTEER